MSARRHLPLWTLLAVLPVLRAAEPEAVPPLPTAATPSAAPAPESAAPTLASPTDKPGDETSAAHPAKGKPLLQPSALSQASTIVVPLSPRFRQIRERIAVLFHDRIDPPPPPDLRFNPFRPPGATVPVYAPADAEGGTTPAPVVAAQADLAILQQAVALLRVRGIVERGGKLLLTINAGPGRDGTYKEGDILTLIAQDQPVHLRVRQITRYSVMFSLRDAELTLKF